MGGPRIRVGPGRRHLGPDERQSIYDKTAGRCWYCGVFVKPSASSFWAKRYIDHKQPFSRGGSDDYDNLVLACHTCNTAKKDKTLEEFRARGLLMAGSGNFGWLDSAILAVAETHWFCRGQAEDELILWLERLQSYLAGRRALFYGESIGCTPDDYCI